MVTQPSREKGDIWLAVRLIAVVGFNPSIPDELLTVMRVRLSNCHHERIGGMTQSMGSSAIPGVFVHRRHGTPSQPVSSARRARYLYGATAGMPLAAASAAHTASAPLMPPMLVLTARVTNNRPPYT
eukprot:CAMPEP_0182938070 /NCGR_PEP_ID=MMETSP0105_2-20130417/43197_1 /TAXON_ID=81532 ORGANISM="Acanthoeca-like sp., Strain 10tr" /NCGR_SAMPLE_ID=MMETSP0105_2 /ASSEMBLY_ACC=CAM_ASM_000205 /LENGTH=126 /DNA_ID=CAMNT_0025077335 /DNA_START=271 /DNA_END=651 /DNA_ORIENTATION=-